MSKNKKIFFAKIVLYLSILYLPAQSQGNTPSFEDRLMKANAAFEAENWERSLQAYELLYEKGFYTERMLYRMAWLHEQDQNYPLAIYYLKKTEKEFGRGSIDRGQDQTIDAATGKFSLLLPRSYSRPAQKKRVGYSCHFSGFVLPGTSFTSYINPGKFLSGAKI